MSNASQIVPTRQDIFEAYLICTEDWFDEFAPTLPTSGNPSPFVNDLDLIGVILDDALESPNPAARLEEHRVHVRGVLGILNAAVSQFEDFEAGALGTLAMLNERSAAEGTVAA